MEGIPHKVQVVHVCISSCSLNLYIKGYLGSKITRILPAGSFGILEYLKLPIDWPELGNELGWIPRLGS